MTVVNHRCAVLGRPIAHSLSPVLHNAAYRALGLEDWSYGRHEVGEGDLHGFLAGLDPSWAGLSLTMPLKRTIQPYGTPDDSWARRLSVANTVVFDWDAACPADADLPAMRLYNTDVPGIVLAFAHAMGADADLDAIAGGAAQAADPEGAAPRGARGADAADAAPDRDGGVAVVLGNGNTAMSAVAACTMMTAPRVGRIVVAARHPERNADAFHALAEAAGRSLRIVALDRAPAELAHADVAVSTMPAHAADPIAAAIAGGETPAPRGTLLDVVYDPRPTALMSAWAERGAHAVGGQEMLLYQAVLQVWRMTGGDAAVLGIVEKPMRQALEEAL